MLPASRRGGGAAGQSTAAGPLPGLARQRAGGLRPPAAPAGSPTAPAYPAAARFRRSYGGCPGGAGRLGRTRGGRRRLAAGAAQRAAPACQTKTQGGPQAPLGFQGASRPAAAPSAGALPYQASGPLPMSGPPAYTAGKPEKFISWFSPAFFKSGKGAEPPTRSRGSAPGGVRGSAPAAAQGRRARSTVRRMEGYSLTPT